MLKDMYNGEAAFWKCLLFVAATFAALKLGLHSDHVFHQVPDDSYSGTAAFIAIAIWQTWCATALYKCADNAKFAVMKAFGKIGGGLIFFATTAVFINSAVEGDYVWGIIAIPYIAWTLYKMFWQE